MATTSGCLLDRHQRRIPDRNCLQDYDGAADCLQGTVEHGEETVPKPFDDAAVVLSNRRLDDLATMVHDTRQRAFLVVRHVFAITHNVAAEDCL